MLFRSEGMIIEGIMTENSQTPEVVLDVDSTIDVTQEEMSEGKKKEILEPRADMEDSTHQNVQHTDDAGNLF